MKLFCKTVLLMARSSYLFFAKKHCRGSNKAAKIVYMTRPFQVIKGYGDFMEGNSSLYIPTLPKLIAIDNVLMDI